MRNLVIWRENDITIESVLPNCFCLIPSDLRRKSLHERIRWTIQYPFGYEVYVLKKINEEIAYCFISNGGNPRYPFAKKNSVIVGPYFVREDERGNGYATLLISKGLDNCQKKHVTAWAFIEKTNDVSIKTIQRIGFYNVGNALYSSFFRVLKPCQDISDDCVYLFRYDW